MNLGRHRESTTVRGGMLAIATEENDLRTAAVAALGLSLLTSGPGRSSCRSRPRRSPVVAAAAGRR